MNDYKYDVIIVGAGSAAFAAAVSARVHGAEKVILIEKAPELESGGNARFSKTGFRFVNEGAVELREFLPQLSDEEFNTFHFPAYSAEDYLFDLQRMTKGRIDLVLADTLIKESNATLHWLREIGHEWEPMTSVIIDGIKYVGRGKPIHSQGWGIQQLARWHKIAKQLGIEIRYDSRVCAIYGNDRKVDGIKVSCPEGEYDLRADAIILCAGGFQANAQKRAQHLGKNADLMKVRGSRHDTGEVLEMALALGAMSGGQWQGAHTSPIDLNAANFECGDHYSRYSYPLGVTVNSDGRRFFDEGEDESTYTYAKTGWELLEQPDAIGFQIFDQQTVPFLRKIYSETATPILANTISELANKLGLEPAVLTHTIDEFNHHVNENIDFDFTIHDGKSTTNLLPKKSNWSSKIEKPPFVAYEVTAGITFTYGGLQINTNAQVLNTLGDPIKGLYASGDILGLFYHNYPSCTGQTRNAVFSRLAGKHAVSCLNSTG